MILRYLDPWGRFRTYWKGSSMGSVKGSMKGFRSVLCKGSMLPVRACFGSLGLKGCVQAF